MHSLGYELLLLPLVQAAWLTATLGAVLKHHEDLQRVRDRGLAELVAEARMAAP